MNHVFIMGQITEASISQSSKGTPILQLIVDTKDGYKDSGNFIKCSVMGEYALNMKANLEVGDNIFIQGKLDGKVYQSDKGVNYFTSVTPLSYAVNTMIPTFAKSNRTAQQPPKRQNIQNQRHPVTFDNNDIPF